jgi:ketosteroid isomerase-like protein
MTVDPEVAAVVEAGYRAFNAGGGFGDFGPLIADDLEWVEGGLAPEGGGVHRGRASFEQWARSWSESFEDFTVEPVETVIEGDAVLVVLHQSGRGRVSGLPIETELVHAWHVRDLRVVRWESYRTLDEALAALRSPSSD